MDYFQTNTEARLRAFGAKNVLITHAAVVAFALVVGTGRAMEVIAHRGTGVSVAASASTRSEVVGTGSGIVHSLVLKQQTAMADNAAKNAALVADLRAIRQRAIAKGLKLLTIEEINSEIRSTRGEA